MSAKATLAKSTVEAIDALSSMWSQIERSRSSKSFDILSERPLNSFTVLEYAVKFNVTLRTARDQLKSMERRGKVLVHFCYLPDGQSHVRVTQVFTIPKA